jgi:ribosomal protein L30E
MAINITLRLKKELKLKGALFGSKIPFKRKELIEKIYISNDCPEQIKNKIENFSKKQKIELIYPDFSKEELKDLCKKPFNISVLSILKEKIKQKKTEIKEKKTEKKKEKKKEKAKTKKIKEKTKKQEKKKRSK